MPITSVTARGIRIPVPAGTSYSNRTLRHRDYLIIEIRDRDTQEVGVGISYIGTGGGKAAVQCVDEFLASTVVGSETSDITGLYARLYQESMMQGRRGIVLRCMSAIDIALWDLAAKRAGVPLAALLGGHTGAVAAYASGGYYRAGDPDRAKTIRTEIEFNKSLGFRDHKIKIGGLPPEEDALRVAAAIEIIGGEGRLAVDANNAYRTPAEAIHATKVLEAAAGEAGLWWMEEPLSPDDFAGHAKVARGVATPIATGEIHQTRYEFLTLLQNESASILQPDVGVVGGITEWLTVARTALTFGIPIAPHWHANVSAHLVAASENGLVVEHFAYEKHIFNIEEALIPESRIRYENGYVLVPDRPGIGWELDEEKVSQFGIE